MRELTLDCREIRCPMPLVRISQMVKNMQPGERLRVDASDPAFRADLEAWLRRQGHRLVEFHEGSAQQAVIEKTTDGGK